MRNAGLLRAADTAAPASPRRVSWNGESSAANSEHLVRRRVFDAALLEDAAAEGVRLLSGRLRQLRHHTDRIEAHIDTLGDGRPTVSCGFLVEARGRAAPAAGSPLRGPETVSFVCTWRGSTTEAGSSVSSFAEGWAWRACSADGHHFLQLTVSGEGNNLPNRSRLHDWFARQLVQLGDDLPQPPDALAQSDIAARGSTSILQGELVTPRMLRVGDAAMAVDPLSGNGIFQSLSSALIAPPVINTLLRHPADAQLAGQFYSDRVRHTFLRFARLGRDFYRQESRWPDSEFWRRRQAWPDDEPAHAETVPLLLGLEMRPVVADDRICMRKVAVTSDHPLGVWHLGGVELAPLLEDLPAAGPLRDSVLSARTASATAGDEHLQAMLAAWLRRYGQLQGQR